MPKHQNKKWTFLKRNVVTSRNISAG